MRVTIERVDGLALLLTPERPGYAHLGVTAGGPWDRRLADLARSRAGADGDLIELVGSLTLSYDGEPTLLGLAGAEHPGTRWIHRSTTAVHATTRRVYVALPGVLTPALPLGATVRRLLPGDVLDLAPAPARVIFDGLEAPTSSTLPLTATWGPRADWFTDAARETFATATYLVTEAADRVGTRLAGPVLERAITRQLPSEGVVRGSVQVPADGQPLVFGPDHPTTGGYPVIAVVDDPDALAQASPGTPVSFQMRP